MRLNDRIIDDLRDYIDNVYINKGYKEYTLLTNGLNDNTTHLLQSKYTHFVIEIANKYKKNLSFELFKEIVLEGLSDFCDDYNYKYNITLECPTHIICILNKKKFIII